MKSKLSYEELKLENEFLKKQLANREAKVTYHEFINNNNSVILLINPNTESITFANDAAIRFYGYTKEELIGMNISRINTLPPEEIKDNIKEAIKNHHNYFTLKHKLSSGEIKDVEVYQSNMTIDNQKMFSLIVHDISEHKRSERELSSSQHKLKESENSMRALFNSMKEIGRAHV